MVVNLNDLKDPLPESWMWSHYEVEARTALGLQNGEECYYRKAKDWDAMCRALLRVKERWLSGALFRAMPHTPNVGECFELCVFQVGHAGTRRLIIGGNDLTLYATDQQDQGALRHLWDAHDKKSRRLLMRAYTKGPLKAFVGFAPNMPIEKE